MRERISELDLDVATVIPASKNARALKDPSDSYYVGTTDVIPIMEITNNNNEAQKFLGSKDILEFFDLTFGQRKPIIEETEEEWKTTLVKTMVGFGEKLPAFLRGNRGKTVAGCALPSGAPRPAEPLVSCVKIDGQALCDTIHHVLKSNWFLFLGLVFVRSQSILSIGSRSIERAGHPL